MTIVDLDNLIKTVCPIQGVSIFDKRDKSTWRIDFKDEATVEQKALAISMMNNANID